MGIAVGLQVAHHHRAEPATKKAEVKPVHRGRPARKTRGTSHDKGERRRRGKGERRRPTRPEAPHLVGGQQPLGARWLLGDRGCTDRYLWAVSEELYFGTGNVHQTFFKLDAQKRQPEPRGCLAWPEMR